MVGHAASSLPVTVSVVVPTHNRRRFLQACLRSVLAQEGVDLEVIVVDDGSTDDTPAMMQSIRDPRVRGVRHSRSRGSSAARNTGIRSARGRWVAFVDDDDLWAPTKLRRQISAGEAADAVLVYCGAFTFVDGCDSVLADRPVPSPLGIRDEVLTANPFPGGTSAQLARREALITLGGFDERLPDLEDWDLWIRLTEHGPVAAVDEPLTAYRLHSSNKSMDEPDRHLQAFHRIAAKTRDSAQRRGVTIDGVGFNHWLAEGQRRTGHRWCAARLHLNAALTYRDFGHLTSAIRSPLGSWALGLRSERPPSLPAPMWLRELREHAPADPR